MELDVCFTFQRKDCTRGVCPQLMTVKPDLDNLVKSVLDGIVDSSVLLDDNQVARISARKRVFCGPPSTAITLIWWRN